MGDSLRNLSHLGLAHNRLTRLDRSLLEALTHLDSLALRSNPWRCDCQLIGLKLWLETYLFKGQTTICSGQQLGNFYNISKVHPSQCLSCWTKCWIIVICNHSNTVLSKDLFGFICYGNRKMWGKSMGIKSTEPEVRIQQVNILKKKNITLQKCGNFSIRNDSKWISCW